MYIYLNVAKETQDKSFKTKNIPVVVEDNLKIKIVVAMRQIRSDEDIYMRKGSAWILHSVVDILLRMNCFKPLRGSTYLNLPQFL